MIKLLIIIAIGLNLAAYSTESALDENTSRTIECKYGYLMSVLKKEVKGNVITIESTYCESRSSWDGECQHEPYKCKWSK